MFSIECSPSTGHCQDFVQPFAARSSATAFTQYYCGVNAEPTSQDHESIVRLICGKSGKKHAQSGFQRTAILMAGGIWIVAVNRADLLRLALHESTIFCMDGWDAFAQEYRAMSDDELLRLALAPDQLTPDASTALTEELSRRRIGDVKQLEAFSAEEQRANEEEQKQAAKQLLLHPYGVGRQRFGKAGRSYDAETQTERFTTTAFFLFCWLPLIPTGTFLVERKGRFLSRKTTVLRRLPLDWEQVLRVWLGAAISVLALMWIIKLTRFLVVHRR